MQLTQTDRHVIRALIEQQLQALWKDDARTAFSFASPAIQTQFGDPDRFLQMVKTHYPTVYRPRSVLFEQVVSVEGQPAQTVLLMSESETLVRAIYIMQKQPNGIWRIHGCFLVPVEAEQ